MPLLAHLCKRERQYKRESVLWLGPQFSSTCFVTHLDKMNPTKTRNSQKLVCVVPSGKAGVEKSNKNQSSYYEYQNSVDSRHPGNIWVLHMNGS